MSPAASAVAADDKHDPAGTRRRRARLAAVQALYQVDITGVPPNEVVDEWRLHRLGRSGEGTAGDTDASLFADLVEGTSQRRADIDGMLSPALAEGWSLGRLEVVLRATLRAGTYELIGRSDVPARVAINEYVDIARGFFSGREPAFVNAVLDKLARRLRPDEFEAGPAAPSGGDPGAEPSR
jgi:transcription antitermination protein NusB